MKKHLLTGLIILMPVALTAFLIHFIFNFLTTPFVTPVRALLLLLQNYFSLSFSPAIHTVFVRLIALIILFFLVLLLGAIARHFFVKQLLNSFNQLLARIPVVKGIYNMSRDVFSALFSADGKKAFQGPVLVPFPCKPTLCVGFLAGEVAEECQQKVPYRLRSVFAPTAPHPISGFLILAPESDIQFLTISNEEALKFLISCGMILPEHQLQ